MMPTFEVVNPKCYEPDGDEDVKLTRPTEICRFSWDGNHKLHFDERSLRRYSAPDIPSQLSKGFDTFRKFDDTNDEHLDPLLETLMAKEKVDGMKTEADVITWRGMMTKILTVLYSNPEFDIFEMHATIFQGTIFIEENKAMKLADEKRQKESLPARKRAKLKKPSNDMMSYWGYKFEALCTGSDKDDVVSNTEQYCSIVETGVGSTSIVIGGEVDAIWDPSASNDANSQNTTGNTGHPRPRPPSHPPHDSQNPEGHTFVELKTSAVPTITKRNTLENQIRRWEFKLMKFWAQSHLLGVAKILVGLRDEEGELQKLQELDTEELPKIVSNRADQNHVDAVIARRERAFILAQSARRSRMPETIDMMQEDAAHVPPTWEPSKCTEFMRRFLAFLREHMSSSDVDQISSPSDASFWKIYRYRQTNTITLQKMKDVTNGEKVTIPSAKDGRILSQDFVNWRCNMPAQRTEEKAESNPYGQPAEEKVESKARARPTGESVEDVVKSNSHIQLTVDSPDSSANTKPAEDNVESTPHSQPMEKDIVESNA